MDNIKQIVENISIFNSLSATDIETLVGNFECVRYKKDSVILSEGELGDFFCILVSGQVSVLKRLPAILQCHNVELKTLLPYTYFGEISLLNDCPRPNSCIAKTDCEVLLLKKEYYLQICQKYSRFLLDILHAHCQRVVKSNQIYVAAIEETIKKNRLIDIGDATSKIVHDIQTPISVIMLTAEIIGHLCEHTGEHTQKIIKQAETMNEFIRDILDFAQGKKSILRLSETDMMWFFEDIMETLVPISESKNIEIEITNQLDRTVMLDRSKMKRCLVNIVRNSIEVIPHNSKIKINSFICENNWHLNISDNGPGIPSDIVDNLFEPFFTKGKKHGTGLGLAICKKVIEDHKGTIHIKNRIDGGVLCEIEIPV